MIGNSFQRLLACGVLVAFPTFAMAQQEHIAAVAPAADGTNSGLIASLDLKTQPRRIRRFERDGGSVGEAKAYDGMIYVARSGKQIHAVRARDGKRIWSTDVCGNGEYVTGVALSCDPTADYVIATSTEGMVAVDRRTGRTIWQRKIDQGLAGSVIDSGRVYAGGYDGHAHCLNLKSGHLIWAHNYLVDAPADPPGFDGDRARLGDRPARPREASCDGDIVVFAVFDQCRLIAIDQETGKRRWSFQTKGWMLGRPTITEEYVFTGSQDKHFYCVDKSDGTLVWKFKTGARVEAPGAISGDDVIFGSCDAKLYCVDQQTGSLNWEFATDKRKKYGGPIYEQPMVSGDKVYLPAMEGQVYAINRQTGEAIWRLRPSRESEIDGSFSDGKQLFITTRVNVSDEGEDALYVLGK